MAKPNKKTVRATIRGSVPSGKLSKAQIVLKDKTDALNIGGFVEYDRKQEGAVIRLGAPASDDAFGITVRGHETRHATHDKPRRRKPKTLNESIATQIVDDVRNESNELPSINASLLKIYKRAHLAVAMQAVHTLKRNQRAILRSPRADTVEMRNGNLLNAVRTVAMLKHYGELDGVSHKEYRVRVKGIKAVQKVIGGHMYKAVRQVVVMARELSKRSRAISTLVALMESPELEDGELPPRGPDGEILTPIEEGDALDGKMEICDLRPKSVYCAKEKQLITRHAPNGVIINAARFVAAVVSGDGNGLFSRRIRLKAGGCVLIDASGSMGATRNNLSALCALVPTATVGYYSGYSAGRGCLCVYAKDGKRYSQELPSDKMRGGNAVDLPAIRWMMKQPKPWTLVSDLEFCGGVLGSEAIAHALVERAKSRGDLTVHNSLDAAYEAFGGKGELKN